MTRARLPLGVDAWGGNGGLQHAGEGFQIAVELGGNESCGKRIDFDLPVVWRVPGISEILNNFCSLAS